MIKANTPIQIGSYILKNRITFAPTVKFDYTDESGLATDLHIRHYEERAKGGCGLICVEATAVVPGGRFGKNHMGLWNEEQMESHKPITEACHRENCVVILQLNHTGIVSNPECGPAIGPSAIEWESYRGKYTTTEMTVDQIHQMQERFVKAAVLAKAAGYDGIQLHGCHGYLINQFMSPVTNHREDCYGQTAMNRARFGVEIIEEIRKQCGKDFLISVRISGLEGSMEESIEVAEAYVNAGCEYLQVSSGIDSLDRLEDYSDSRVSKIQSLGVRFHDYFKGRIPVSCVGGIQTPEDVNYLIQNELVDTVDVAKAILADPNFADAVINNIPYTKCFNCKACQYGPFTQHKCPAELVRKKMFD